VNAARAYGVAMDTSDTVRSARVGTTALRLEVQLPEKFSAGIQEWKVK